MKMARNVGASPKKKSRTKAASGVASRSKGKSTPLWRTVLVPTDFSPESERAVEYGLALAEQANAKLVLAHVVVPVAAPDLVYGPVAWDHAAAIESARDRLLDLKQAKGFEVAKRARIEVLHGNPYREIDSLAKRAKADLIVISTHGRTGLKHLLLGSVAEKIVRYAPCPVLVLRD